MCGFCDSPKGRVCVSSRSTTLIIVGIPTGIYILYALFWYAMSERATDGLQQRPAWIPLIDMSVHCKPPPGNAPCPPPKTYSKFVVYKKNNITMVFNQTKILCQ